MIMAAYMLTTKDNPFNPVTDFNAWYNWDTLHGHDCCGLLARLASTSDALTEAENQQEINNAIAFIIAHDFQDVYRRVEIPQQYIDKKKKKYYSELLDDDDSEQID